MLRIVSTHVFLRQRLHPGLLESLAKGGAQGVEFFAARQHFDYATRAHVQEIANWFRSSPLQPFSIHMPLFADAEMGRSGAPPVNVIHPDKARRIDGMDEIKRALEAAELLPLKFLVLHLGEREDGWNPRTVEHALTAIEHLQAFARPLGVKLLLENIQNEATRPEHLLEILAIGHFKDVGVCLDLGHAHIGEGVRAGIEEAKGAIFSAHIHDNHGMKDEHLWPGEGTIPWEESMEALRTAPNLAGAVLEIHYQSDDSPAIVSERAAASFRKLGLE
ncbi:MAG TPA: sugar phosphate isomerase/epimerase family protein [Acidobacteriaceae bacterium]|nr:sugar phosphate isomerase/epimerase family protein [Acidobacteriaceae bacterium]